MKEKLYTIPLNDAVNAGTECPFCYIERKIEQDLIDFVLGSSSSYMESGIREKTDNAGFCRAHFKKMYDYGNTLGNAWILKTHMKKMNDQLQGAVNQYTPSGSGSLFMRKKSDTASCNAVVSWIHNRNSTCFICDQFDEHYKRYLETFFELYSKDKDFKKKVDESKGLCLPHFGDLCEFADSHLNEKQKAAFYPPMFTLMKENMSRLYEDVSWLIEKFDYQNKDADWKNSRDALQNCMQKLKGGFPADAVYKMKK